MNWIPKPKVDTITPENLSLKYMSSVYNKVHRLNFNFLGMVAGKHRVGKSLFSTEFSYMLDPSFWPNLEKRVVYYPNEFMKALKILAQDEHYGGAVVWDEAGVGLPAREWYDISNKAINYVIQVFGYLRPIVLFVSQDISYIDKQPRKIFHTFFEMTRPTKKYAVAKIFDILYDKKKDRPPYFKYPRIRVHKGPSYILKSIKIPLPPKELIDRYENHSKPFKDKIMAIMEERAKRIVYGDMKKKEYSVPEIIEDILADYKYYETRTSRKGRIILDDTAIRYTFHIPADLAKFIKSRCEKKVQEEFKNEVVKDSSKVGMENRKHDPKHSGNN